MTHRPTEVVRARRHVSGWLGTVVLCAFLGAITLVNQVWVGGATLYQDSMVPKREAMHQALLHNRLPPGVASWNDIGADGANTRVLTVWTAEGLHRLLGVRVAKAYWLIETAGLFAYLLALFLYLRHWFEAAGAALGLSYVAAVLPLTYFLHYFHPWDKPSWLVWVLLLTLLRSRRILGFAVLLLFSVLIKYDTILLPGLYLLAFGSRKTALRDAAAGLLLFGVSFGAYYALQALIPGGFGHRSMVDFMARNLSRLAALNITAPPVLALGIPTLLGAIGWPKADRFVRATFLFGLPMVAVFFLQTNFEEVRAQMPVLILLLPGALIGLQRILDPVTIQRTVDVDGR